MFEFTIHVQAAGGKILGDDVGGARIVGRAAIGGEIRASGVTRGDSRSVPSP